jgi:hypothetical protein
MGRDKTGSDPADVFRRMVLLLVKWLLYCVILVAVLGAVLAGAFYAHQWFTHDRHASQIEAKVETTVCTEKDFPLLVWFKNGSTKNLDEVSFRLSARKKSHSTDLTEYHRLTDDRIRKPGETIGTCWSLPRLKEAVDDPLKLEWSVVFRATLSAIETHSVADALMVFAAF